MVILGVSGSLRSESYNTALLRAAAGLVASPVRLEIYADLGTIPPYSEDRDTAVAPRAVERLRNRIARADALLIATPEYNASVPGQLKNALDWASRPFPDNALRRKPVAVAGVSTGLFGAVWAQAELRKVLSTAGAAVLERDFAIASAYDAFSEGLELRDAAAVAALERLVADLVGASPPVARLKRAGRQPIHEA